jgi:hypothetical protein
MSYHTGIQLENYREHEQHLPSTGRFVIAQFDEASLIVYQAFNDDVARYAVEHQHFGGPAYDFGRTTWLKPSFLWMMYYSGWARKENQENVLAIRIRKEGFDEILKSAELHRAEDTAPATGEVILEWHTYHDLFGNKTGRKAAKIGLNGAMLRRFNEEWILSVENITPYVQQQQKLVREDRLNELQLPHERAYAPEDLRLLNRLDATNISL